MTITHPYKDTAALTGRSLHHVLRSPDTIITTVVTPIALMLVFVYVFGGAIETGASAAGTTSYLNYMLPGILLITIASGIGYTSYRLFVDRSGGIFERFRSMPIGRSSALWAHVLTSMVAIGVSLVVVVGVALIMGFRTGASVLGWLAVAGILMLFTLALTWVAVVAGLTASSVDGAGGVRLSADLPAVRQFCVRAHRDDARAGAMVRREPAGDRARRHDARHLRRAPGGRRRLDRPRVVRRHPRSRLRRRDGGLPSQHRLVSGVQVGRLVRC